jgi:uncharacterized membrane protein YfcA
MLYLEIALASLIAGALDTVVGFGGGLLLLPVLVLVVGSKDAVLLAALIPLGWNIPRIVLLRQWINWRVVGLFALGIVPGTLIGALLLDSVDPELLRRAIGGLLVLFGIYYVMRLYMDLPGPRGVKSWVFPIVGVLSGIVSGLLGAGHGPLQAGALIAADLPVREVSAINGALGGLTAAARVGSYGVAGLLHEGIWIPALVGIVGAALGAVLGIRLSRRSKDSTLELIVGVAIALAGIRMIF